MDPDTVHTIMKKFITVLTGIWIVFLVPSMIMVILTIEDYSSFSDASGITKDILYYNILTYPFILIVSIVLSWTFFKHKKYWTAVGCSLIPMASVFIELIAADIALAFT